MNNIKIHELVLIILLVLAFFASFILIILDNKSESAGELDFVVISKDSVDYGN